MVDITAIGSVESATKSVRQQLLGEAAGKRVSTRQEGRLELRRPLKGSTARQLARGVNRLTFFV